MISYSSHSYCVSNMCVILCVVYVIVCLWNHYISIIYLHTVLLSIFFFMSSDDHNIIVVFSFNVFYVLKYLSKQHAYKKWIEQQSTYSFTQFHLSLAHFIFYMLYVIECLPYHTNTHTNTHTFLLFIIYTLNTECRFFVDFGVDTPITASLPSRSGANKCVFPGVTTMVWIGICNGISKTGFSLYQQ